MMILTAMSGCHRTHEPDVPPEPSPVNRTVLVYMAANNNLGSSGYDDMDMQEMQTAVNAGDLNGGRLIVYHADYRKQPRLLEMVKDSTPLELKIYDAGISSLDPMRMTEVFADMRAQAPADSYGLVLWSHGTGWTEPSRSGVGEPVSKPGLYAFGNDGGKEQSIPTLREALEDQGFEWIYFDACHMACAEVAYELRDVTQTIVGSGTELQAYGMRYDRNMKHFFTDKPDMIGAARETFTYYSTEAPRQACTISVIETAKMDALAKATRAIMETGALPVEGYEPIPFMTWNPTLFDMGHYIRSLNVSASLIAEWNKAYSAAIPYYASTETYGSLYVADYTGMGCQILYGPGYEETAGYNHLQWWEDVVRFNPSLEF